MTNVIELPRDAAVEDDEPLPIVLSRRDLREHAKTLGLAEIRYSVDYYYTVQRHRIRANNQRRSLEETNEVSDWVRWLGDMHAGVEGAIKVLLEEWTLLEPTGMGRWARSIMGIGPVLSAGLLAHIDVAQAPTVGHIWRFAGLDPTVRWERNTKRPWNARLKLVCWKIGHSFVLTANREGSQYGPVYAKRKELETAKNEAGDYAELARESLAAKRWREGTDARKAYEAGRLPASRIQLRAQRYAVKLFLAHWHHRAFEARYGKPPPKPYVIEHLGHAHLLEPPPWPA